MAFSCPERKAVVRSIKDNATRKDGYLGAVKRTPVTSEAVNWSSVQKDVVTSVMCLIVASAKEKETPGSFQEVLTSLQKTNNVPCFKLGGIVLPESFLNNSSGNHGNESVLEEPVTNENESVIEDVSGTSTCRGRDDRGSSSAVVPITIVKKKTAPKVTPANVEALYKAGHIFFESTGKKTQDQCLKLLREDSVMCSAAIAAVKSRDFRTGKFAGNSR